MLSFVILADSTFPRTAAELEGNIEQARKRTSMELTMIYQTESILKLSIS